MPPRRRSWVQRRTRSPPPPGWWEGAVLIAPPIRRSLARALGVASDAAPATPDTAGVSHSVTEPLSSGPKGESSTPQPSIGTVTKAKQAAKKWRKSSSSGESERPGEAKESTTAAPKPSIGMVVSAVQAAKKLSKSSSSGEPKGAVEAKESTAAASSSTGATDEAKKSTAQKPSFKTVARTAQAVNILQSTDQSEDSSDNDKSDNDSGSEHFNALERDLQRLQTERLEAERLEQIKKKNAEETESRRKELEEAAQIKKKEQQELREEELVKIQEEQQLEIEAANKKLKQTYEAFLKKPALEFGEFAFCPIRPRYCVTKPTKTFPTSTIIGGPALVLIRV